MAAKEREATGPCLRSRGVERQGTAGGIVQRAAGEGPVAAPQRRGVADVDQSGSQRQVAAERADGVAVECASGDGRETGHHSVALLT